MSTLPSSPAEQGVRIDIQQGCALVTIDREPNAPNALNEILLAQITSAVDQLLDDVNVEAIWLTGRPDAFLVGVDVQFFLSCILSQDIGRVVRFTEKAHGLLATIERSHKFVGAWVRGRCLGAGLELALACHRIVTTPDGKFSFPETSLGVYPGMGGTQRTPRRIGTGLAKWMIYTGSVVSAEHALEIGLVDLVSEANFPEVTSQEIGGSNRHSPTVSARYAALEQLVLDHGLEDLNRSTFRCPANPVLTRAIIQLQNQAPIALRLSECLIDSALNLSLDDGLQRELESLPDVFQSEDALEGFSSYARGRPRFTGR